MARNRKRADILAELDEKNRAFSTATVLRHAALAARLGLHPTDHKCADLLIREGPMSAGEIAAATGLTTGSVTALINRLEKAGLARRVPDASDRRRVLVEVIRGSRVEQRLGALLAPIRSSFRQAIAPFTNQELEVIVEYLSRTEVVLRESIRMLQTNREGEDSQ